MIVIPELIILSASLIRLLGMVSIAVLKIPVLNQLEEDFQKEFKENIYQKTKKKLIEIIKNFIAKISFENFFQKILSRIRILNLKIENKIANYLQGLREKQKKAKENKNYWEKLKNFKK